MTRGKTSTDSTTQMAGRLKTDPAAARGWVAFVGSGPGDPGLLTVRAVDLLREADVVITESPDHEALVRSVRGGRAATRPAPSSSTAGSARTASRSPTPLARRSWSSRPSAVCAWCG